MLGSLTLYYTSTLTHDIMAHHPIKHRYIYNTGFNLGVLQILKGEESPILFKKYGSWCMAFLWSCGIVKFWRRWVIPLDILLLPKKVRWINLCYAPKHPNNIKREREVNPSLENEREVWMRSLFEGETSFYNITHVQDEMLSKTRFPWYIQKTKDTITIKGFG